MQSTVNGEKLRLGFVKVLIHNQLFRNKLIDTLYAFQFDFLFSWSVFTFYGIYIISHTSENRCAECRKFI